MPRTEPPERPTPAERRLRGHGARALSDAELLGLVLGREFRRVLHGGALLERLGGLEALRDRESAELESEHQLGRARAVRLLASIELGRRVHRRELRLGEPLTCAEAAAQHVRSRLCAPGREEFHVVLLDTKHRVLGARLISIGSLQSSLVHPREAFRPAVQLGACSVVVAHNHPSGDPCPSSEDSAVTERLREAGQLLGIRLLDHLVLGATRFYSFAEGCQLPYPPGEVPQKLSG